MNNLDLARECGATLQISLVDRANVLFTPSQLDAFAERIRADAVDPLSSVCGVRAHVVAHREQQQEPSIHAGSWVVGGDLSTSLETREREAFFEHIAPTSKIPRTDAMIASVIEYSPGAWRAWQARAALAASQTSDAVISEMETPAWMDSRALEVARQFTENDSRRAALQCAVVEAMRFATCAPARKPLTDDQLSLMAAACLDRIDDGDYFEIARAVEAKHGITGDAG